MNKITRDYGSFVVWMAPLLFAVVFANIFLIPKVEKYLDESQLPIAEGSFLQNCVSFLMFFVQIYRFVAGSFWIVIPVAIGLIVLAEFRFNGWQKHREKILRTGNFLLMLIVITCLLLMSIVLIAVAPTLPK